MLRPLLAVTVSLLVIVGCKRGAEPDAVEPAPGATAEVQRVAEPKTQPPETTSPLPTADPEPARPATRPPDGSPSPDPATPPDPLDPEMRLAGQAKKVEEYATKFRGLTMAAGFLNDEEYDTLVEKLSAIVEKASALVAEAELAGVDEQPAMLDGLDGLLEDIVKADEAAVERLRVIRGR